MSASGHKATPHSGTLLRSETEPLAAAELREAVKRIIGQTGGELQSNDIHAILTGIVYDDAARLILLRSEGVDELVLLREGQVFDGWTLLQVERGWAVFRNGDREAVLELVFGRDTDPIPATENKKQ